MNPIHLTSAAPGSAEYLKATAGMITASQAASVLCPGEPGVYGTPMDVYVRLRQGIEGKIEEPEPDEPEHDDEPEDEDMLVESSERAELSWGLDSEPMHKSLLTKYAKLHIADLNGTYRDAEIPWLGATPDGMVLQQPEDEPGILELKAPTDGGRRLWAAGPPKGYIIQANVQMRVMRADWGVVSALIPPKPRWERVYNSPEMQEFIITGLTRFMEDHVLPGVPPPITGSSRDFEALKKLFPDSERKVVSLSPQGIENAKKLREARKAKTLWEKEVERLQAPLIIEMGTAEYAHLPDGTVLKYATQLKNMKAKEAHVQKSRPMTFVKEIK